MLKISILKNQGINSDFKKLLMLGEVTKQMKFLYNSSNNNRSFH